MVLLASDGGYKLCSTATPWLPIRAASGTPWAAWRPAYGGKHPWNDQFAAEARLGTRRDHLQLKLQDPSLCHLLLSHTPGFAQLSSRHFILCCLVLQRLLPGNDLSWLCKSRLEPTVERARELSGLGLHVATGTGVEAGLDWRGSSTICLCNSCRSTTG